MSGSTVLPLSSGPRVTATRRARENAADWRATVDLLADLVAATTGAPMVTALLVLAETQVLLGSAGGTLPADDVVELPLTVSLCHEVVVSGLPLIIRDAAADPRFADTEPVRVHGTRAYAGFPIRDENGIVVGVFAAAEREPHDWTARQLTTVDGAAQLLGALLCGAATVRTRERNAADEHRAFLDALLDSVDSGVVACDRQGRLVLVNRALRNFAIGPADIHGSPPEEWQGRFNVKHPDGRPYRQQEMPLVRALGGETVREADQVIDDPEGRPHQYTCNATPIIDAAGQCLGAVAAVHDVTDERRAQRFHRCELAVARAIAHAPTLEAAGHDILAALGDTLGWPYAELWLHDTDSATMRPITQWSHDPAGATVPVPERLPTGFGLVGVAWTQWQPVWVQDVHRGGLLSVATMADCPLKAAVVVPIRSGDDVYGALTVFSATPERPSDALSLMLAGVAAQFGQHLQQHRAEALALQLARSKDEYIRLVGHEMRTPLTSIVAYTDLLADLGDHLSPDARQLLDAITRNSDRLRRIIDALLDLAALDSGHVTMDPARFDLADAVRACAADAVRPDWPVRVAVIAPGALRVEADEARIRGVVEVLLSNAVTYSHPGGNVAVALTATGGEAVLTVTDAGIGIPADEFDQVFERFHRSSRVRDLGIPGTGLGLAASRLVMHHHHGNIALRPATGGGVTAEMRLPLHFAR